jgi:NAD-dependent dihydropyrimidine dehydrogenase PreA subunit
MLERRVSASGEAKVAVRKIIEIDEEKCDGCGLCAEACHEGAIQIVGGKAKLVSESYCDGLGDCLGECPRGAITILEREAAPFDAAAGGDLLEREAAPFDAAAGGDILEREAAPFDAAAGGYRAPQLRQWPVQLMLVPPGAPFLQGADLLVTADCVPFATADYHRRYLTGKATVVGCPKLDDIQHYYEKLKEMFREARPRSITVLRMEVPCCGGISKAVERARNETVPHTDLQVITIGIRGEEESVESIPSP